MRPGRLGLATVAAAAVAAATTALGAVTAAPLAYAESRPGAGSGTRANAASDPRPVTVTLTATPKVAYGALTRFRVTVSAPPAETPAPTPAPAPAPTPTPTSPAGPTTGPSAEPAAAAGDVLEPVSKTVVMILKKTDSGWEPLRQVSTNARGTAAFATRLRVGKHALRATVDADPAAGLASGSSTWTRTLVTRASTRLAVTGAKIVSEQTAHLSVRLTSPTAPDDGIRRWVQVRTRPHGTRTWSRPHPRQLDATGGLTLPVRAWRSVDVDVRFVGGDLLAPAHASTVVWTRGALAVVNESGRPRPKKQHPVGEAPVGAGPNGRISTIPDQVWRSMVGVSWTRGCPVGRADLRYVSVNYWGFDGYRYRGHIIVAATIARPTVGALSELYQRKFRIRSMRPADVYGHNPRGPGANDYASMAADNTSGFNCRYVVGKESQKVWSPHAYGIAVDVNPWENPYMAPTGIFPNSWYLTHRNGAGVITASVAHAFTGRGFFWGDWWVHKDIHHFEMD